MREWKPGDVAMVTTYGQEHVAMRDWDGWVYAGEREQGKHYSGSTAIPIRPLVVIDPEDDAETDRLRDVLRRHGAELNGANVYGALREFANPTPPKPDEPTGLGAVVEDFKGDRWVLIEVSQSVMGNPQPTPQWRTWWGNRPYDQIAAVRVLSEGVTA